MFAVNSGMVGVGFVSAAKRIVEKRQRIMAGSVLRKFDLSILGGIGAESIVFEG
jgi:hypothetical protein